MSTETDENEDRTKKTAGVLRHSRRQREKQLAFNQHDTDQLAVGQHAINAAKHCGRRSDSPLQITNSEIFRHRMPHFFQGSST